MSGTTRCAALTLLAVLTVGAYAETASPFAAEDAFLPDKVAAKIVDLNLSARFVAGDKVLFRRGARGNGRILLADPATGDVTTLIAEPALKAALKKAGAKLAPGTPVRPRDYDAAKQILNLDADHAGWRYDIAAGTATKLPPPPPPPQQETAVSPDGKTKVIVRDYNLIAIDVKSGREVALTRDGSYDNRYGINYPLFGDMAMQNTETPKMPIDVQWSEDSRRILSYRMRRNGAYVWHGIQQTPPDDRFPRMFRYVYPTAGARQVPQIAPVVIDVAKAMKSGKARITALKVPELALLWPGDPPMWWEKGRVMYEWTRRGYGEVNLYEVDPATGKGVVRVHEAVRPVVTVTSSFIRSAPELNGYLNVSERSGWAQLYFLRRGEDPAGGKALTRGNWEVAEILRVNADGNILIRGNGREAGVNPYYNSLYRVDLSGRIVDLTPEPLDHEVTLSDDGKWFIDRMSTPTDPTRTLLRAASDGHVIAELGRADPTALLAAGFTPPETFKTLADDGKTMLYGIIRRPSHFDPHKSYPVIDYVYTGPTTHIVPERYDRATTTFLNALAETGAIVVSIDGRGTSQRGQAFRQPAFQNIGEVGIDDHIAVLKAMAKKYPALDLSRVGVYGHSAGGFDAARFILRRPGFFKAAVASSGIQDPRLDKAWWPEVSMGLADDATWERNSNIPVAKNLKGKLMIVHGDIDDNVPIAASFRLHKALVDADKLHDFVIIPNRKHDDFTPYYFHNLYNFFLKNLVALPPGK